MGRTARSPAQGGGADDPGCPDPGGRCLWQPRASRLPGLPPTAPLGTRVPSHARAHPGPPLTSRPKSRLKAGRHTCRSSILRRVLRMACAETSHCRCGAWAAAGTCCCHWPHACQRRSKRLRARPAASSTEGQDGGAVREAPPRTPGGSLTPPSRFPRPLESISLPARPPGHSCLTTPACSLCHQLPRAWFGNAVTQEPLPDSMAAPPRKEPETQG